MPYEPYANLHGKEDCMTSWCVGYDPFELHVREGTGSIMFKFQTLNGVHDGRRQHGKRQRNLSME